MRKVIQSSSILLLMIILPACSHQAWTEKASIERSVASSPFEYGRSHEDDQPFPVDQDNFIVHQFQLSYDRTAHAMDYLVTYSLGSVSAEYMQQDHHPYYMYLTLPKKEAQYFSAAETETVRGIQPSEDYNNELYQLELSAPLAPKVTEAVIQDLVAARDDYSLTLYENEDSSAYVISDLNDMVESSSNS